VTASGDGVDAAAFDPAADRPPPLAFLIAPSNACWMSSLAVL